MVKRRICNPLIEVRFLLSAKKMNKIHLKKYKENKKDRLERLRLSKCLTTKIKESKKKYKRKKQKNFNDTE